MLFLCERCCTNIGFEFKQFEITDDKKCCICSIINTPLHLMTYSEILVVIEYFR